jgi:hypothetical protein
MFTLILIVWQTGVGGSTIQQMDFSSMERCDKARTAVVQQFRKDSGDRIGITAVCVQRSNVY